MNLCSFSVKTPGGIRGKSYLSRRLWKILETKYKEEFADEITFEFPDPEEYGWLAIRVIHWKKQENGSRSIVFFGEASIKEEQLLKFHKANTK